MISSNPDNALFVDTSGWGYYFDQSDPHHGMVAAIIATSLKQGRKLITTNYILAELVALISTGRIHISHADMVTAITLIKAEPAITIEHIDPMTDEESWRLIVARPDKQWSLVDASSFVLMKRLGIDEALTNDHHFEQAGYIRLIT